MAARTDLWGDIAPTATRTPLAILREQAALLGTKTKNLVEATVKTEVLGEQFVHRFRLIVPALSNYTYELFKVRHGVAIYPITVLGSGAGLADRLSGTADIELATEQQFTEWLGAQLSSEKTMRIVANLLAQVTG